MADGAQETLGRVLGSVERRRGRLAAGAAADKGCPSDINRSGEAGGVGEGGHGNDNFEIARFVDDRRVVGRDRRSKGHDRLANGHRGRDDRRCLGRQNCGQLLLFATGGEGKTQTEAQIKCFFLHKNHRSHHIYGSGELKQWIIKIKKEVDFGQPLVCSIRSAAGT